MNGSFMDVKQFCGGSRVIPLNTSMGDPNNQAFHRFMDKNKMAQREREVMVEQALESANKRYNFNVNAAKEHERYMKMMLETNRMRAVQKADDDKKRLRENLASVRKHNSE